MLLLLEYENDTFREIHVKVFNRKIKNRYSKRRNPFICIKKINRNFTAIIDKEIDYNKDNIETVLINSTFHVIILLTETNCLIYLN